MIIPDKYVSATNELMSDPRSDSTELRIRCGTDGLYSGAIYENNKILAKTGKFNTFRQALDALLIAAYKEFDGDNS